MPRAFSVIAVLLLSACANPPSADRAPLATAGPVAVIADAAPPQIEKRLAGPLRVANDARSAREGMTVSPSANHAAVPRSDVAPAVRAHLVRVLEKQASLPLVPAKAAARTLTIRADAIGLEEGQYLSDSLALYLVVQARWSGDSQERNFVYRSSERPAGVWSDAAVAAELNAAYRELGERIAEEMFMQAGLAPAAGSACGLKWVAPERLYRPQLGAAPWEWNRFIVLKTRTPTLAWEPFLDYALRAGGEAVAEGAREVRYDVRIWQALPASAPLLVYERQGLATTEHTVEMRLRANTRYYWSVRARFTAPDGGTRATTWGRFRLPYAAVSRSQAAGSGLVRDPCQLDFLAEPNYYRFATPVK